MSRLEQLGQQGIGSLIEAKPRFLLLVAVAGIAVLREDRLHVADKFDGAIDRGRPWVGTLGRRRHQECGERDLDWEGLVAHECNPGMGSHSAICKISRGTPRATRS